MSRNGTRNDFLGAPAGAPGSNRESGGPRHDPGRSVDDIIREIRRTLGQGEVAGASRPDNQLHGSPLGSDNSRRNVYVDRVSMAASDAARRVMEFYATHRKCRWCINITSAVAGMTLLLVLA